MTIICKLEFLGDAITITRRDGTSGFKQLLNLRELGGKYADTYIATLFSDRICTLSKGTWLLCNLRFSTHRFESMDYQDVTLQDYVVLPTPQSSILPQSSVSSLPTIPTLPQLPHQPLTINH